MCLVRQRTHVPSLIGPYSPDYRLVADGPREISADTRIARALFRTGPLVHTRVGGGILSTHSMAGGLWGLVTALLISCHGLLDRTVLIDEVSHRAAEACCKLRPCGIVVVLENTNMKRIGLLVVAVSLSLSVAALAQQDQPKTERPSSREPKPSNQRPRDPRLRHKWSRRQRRARRARSPSSSRSIRPRSAS